MTKYPLIIGAFLLPMTVLAQNIEPQMEETPPDVTDSEVIETTQDTAESTETSVQTPPPPPAVETEPAPSAVSSEEPDGGVLVNPPSLSNHPVDVALNVEQRKEGVENPYLWNLRIGGYLRTGFTNIQNDPNNDLFGRNDGFIVASARLTIEGDILEQLTFRLQLDGAIDQDLGGTRPLSQLDTRLRDAIIAWKPLDYVRINAGQFKAPFEVEETYSRAEQLFVQNSVASRGVGVTEGFAVDGLSRDREAGVMLDAPIIRFGAEDGLGVRYALALTNGRPASLQGNDNDSFATYGRLEVYWADMVRLGGAVQINEERLQAEEADFIDQDVFGFTADLTFQLSGVTLIGNFTQTTSEIAAISAQPSVTSTGYQVSLAYQEPFFGFQPAVRYAYLDPTSDTSGQTPDPLFENDARTFYTIGLNYNPDYPIRLMLNYTITDEESAVALENNRFDALLQVVF